MVPGAEDHVVGGRPGQPKRRAANRPGSPRLLCAGIAKVAVFGFQPRTEAGPGPGVVQPGKLRASANFLLSRWAKLSGAPGGYTSHRDRRKFHGMDAGGINVRLPAHGGDQEALARSPHPHRQGAEKLSAATRRIIRGRIDHTATGEGGLELLSPQGQIEAWKVSDVAAVLAEAEAAARQGWYAAGFVAYEAAPAFDGAFRVRTGSPPGQTIPSLPLAWFGLFAESRPVEGHREASEAVPSDDTPWRCDLDAATHAEDVDTIRRAIADGDAYLVNHTGRFRRPWVTTDDPFDLYSRLVAGHNGGYHAYLETTEWAVACGSPELFFDLSSHHLTTRPMKGTAPRGRWAAEDAETRQRWRHRPKNGPRT